MRYYDELAVYDRAGFRVVVDKTWEDISPADCFDTSIDPDTGKPYYDVEQMCRDIDRGQLDWFVLRVRVFVDDLLLESGYVGGMLYEDAREVLTDGMAEDLIADTLEAAKDRIFGLKQRFGALSEAIDKERAEA
jgi:hypothetical protein